MKRAIADELQILWSFDDDVEGVIEALGRLKSATTPEDVPDLTEALNSPKSDFWIRELLSDPICYISGAKYIPDLFEAFAKNYADGHDNDGFANKLMGIAHFEPIECRAKIEELLSLPDYPHSEYATWLLEVCKN